MTSAGINTPRTSLPSPQLAHFIKLEELRGSEGLNDLKVEQYRRVATCITVFSPYPDRCGSGREKSAWGEAACTWQWVL